jgi:hypothetical protein
MMEVRTQTWCAGVRKMRALCEARALEKMKCVGGGYFKRPLPRPHKYLNPCFRVVAQSLPPLLRTI